MQNGRKQNDFGREQLVGSKGTENNQAILHTCADLPKETSQLHTEMYSSEIICSGFLRQGLIM